ncbi:MAG TPA: hypothetical protein VHB98_17620 [Chloroflexota bacterium]|nr:hypothetical protein [Chloroflexota bacterium]
MTASRAADLAPLRAAKSRVPLLPVVYVPRPDRMAELEIALAGHRLVLLCAGGLVGKTTLLVELVRGSGPRRYHWYSVDELDNTAQALLEGLALAVTGAPCTGDETILLAQIIAALDRQDGAVVLVLDDLHRSPAAGRVLDRLLRYLPPHARLLAATRPEGLPQGSLCQWLADQGQLVQWGPADLQLTPIEQARFAQATGRAGSRWPVTYRPGGEAALADGLLAGVLPLLAPELYPPLEALAVLGTAQVSLLAAALQLPIAETARRLHRLACETILVEPAAEDLYRLSEAARLAVVARLDQEGMAAMCYAVAAAVEPYDCAEAARLFAQAGAVERAALAAARLGLVGWWRRRALAAELEALLPACQLPMTGALALTLALSRMVQRGAVPAHALVRRTRVTNAEERMEQLRLLGLCSAARGRPWSVNRAICHLEALVDDPDARITPGIRGFGQMCLATLRSRTGDLGGAAAALERCLSVLVLGGEHDERAQGVRRQALHLLGRIRFRQGDFAAADRLYAEAAAAAEGAHTGLGAWLAELANNRAILLAHCGRHQESLALLTETLASPWPAELGLRPLLLLSQAEAHAALGEAATAATALRAVLAESEANDVRGIAGHAHALLALGLAAEGHHAAAAAELAAGTPETHPATLLARALLLAPDTPEARRLAAAAATGATEDRPLRALALAYQALMAHAAGDKATARSLVGSLKRDPSYPLCPREAAVLGGLSRLRYRARGSTLEPAGMRGVQLRFFGDPSAIVAGVSLGAAGWRYTATRDLFWYALAHDTAGFTREEALTDLFPDQDTIAAGRLLRNGLYGLRQLLAHYCDLTPALGVSAGNLRLLPDELGCPLVSDLATLRERLGRLRAGDVQAGEGLPQLLGGHYLAPVYGDWVAPFRTYWEQEAVRALDLAATLFERAGRSQEALESLQAEIVFCPDDALLVQRVLRLCSILADGGAMRTVYLQHCRTARDVLGVEPDQEVVTLYKELARS